MGHKRLAIEAGEDPVNNPIEYILECIKTIYSINQGTNTEYVRNYLLEESEKRQILLFTCQKREGAYLNGHKNVTLLAI